jgi:hypothetical protein
VVICAPVTENDLAEPRTPQLMRALAEGVPVP